MEIINWKDTPGSLYHEATFDVYLGPKWGVTFPNMRLKKSKTGNYYVDRPVYVKSESPEGKKEYGRYPEMEESKWKAFHTVVMPLVQPFLKRPESFSPPATARGTSSEQDLPF